MKNIQKGQKLLLANELSDKSFNIGINWEQPANQGYEIDSSVMLLSERGKFEKEEDLIFYNNLSSSCGSVKMHSIPIAAFKKSLEIDLDKITNETSRIMFILTIDNGDTLNHRFENVTGISFNLTDKANNIVL